MRTLREEAERFDRRAGRYDRWLLQRWFFRPVHRTILRALHLRRGERFLEVGCGTGTLTLAAAETTGWAAGVDPSPGMIAQARRKPAPPDATETIFLVGAAESLPLADDTVDVAASSISMHHWVDLGAGLREVGRVLRPGGRVILADVAPRGAGRGLALVTGLGGHRDHTAFRPEGLAAAVRDAGFIEVRVLRRGFLSRLVAFVAARRP